MNSNQVNDQFGQGSKIDKKETKNSHENDDDFLSGDNQIKYHPNLDKYEMSTEEEDRYNNGTSEHDDLIDDSKPRYSSPSRNGSHRNH